MADPEKPKIEIFIGHPSLLSVDEFIGQVRDAEAERAAVNGQSAPDEEPAGIHSTVPVQKQAFNHRIHIPSAAVDDALNCDNNPAITAVNQHQHWAREVRELRRIERRNEASAYLSLPFNVLGLASMVVKSLLPERKRQKSS